MQEAELAANVIKADVHQRIVLAPEPHLGRPVHLFGFVTVATEDVCPTAQPIAELVGFSGCAVASAFS